ncbi:DUF2889 domain-containing protein [Amphritea japonica]|uniref:DUF2889 domain-containing protein n=1 Tax=Amphritea japonica ATCC BAA-1530 TaxID=1278309 RepID=A0A7R6PCI5_9GAMM|nr:DUF2889 domain-containing protein [Amphritea japonica]BBB27502.1 conserved hypothetical protein [Amphritea japonica ATCC BAA-1530]
MISDQQPVTEKSKFRSLSKPVRRKLQHRRSIESCAYLRDDGLWDVEARMIDIKTETVPLPLRGDVAAGEPFHDLGLRVTLDQRLLIHQIEAFIDASPFPICARITGSFRVLEGTRIGPGWHRQCKELTGGFRGCTHLNELLPVIATTAIQAVWPNSDLEVMKLGASMMVNSCHSWAQNSEVIEELLPEYYTPEVPDTSIKQE